MKDSESRIPIMNNRKHQNYSTQSSAPIGQKARTVTITSVPGRLQAHVAAKVAKKKPA